MKSWSTIEVGADYKFKTYADSFEFQLDSHSPQLSYRVELVKWDDGRNGHVWSELNACRMGGVMKCGLLIGPKRPWAHGYISMWLHLFKSICIYLLFIIYFFIESESQATSNINQNGPTTRILVCSLPFLKI